MTLDETQVLLVKVSAIDAREFNRLHVAAWHEILEPFTIGEAMLALHRFRSERPGVWLEPGHLVQIMREVTISKMRRL